IGLAAPAAVVRAGRAEAHSPEGGRAEREERTEPVAAGLRGVDDLVDLLARGLADREVMELADAEGSLCRLFPEWEGVRGRRRRDPYPRYPRDVHLIRSAAAAARPL